jgi:hypothetical protein
VLCAPATLIVVIVNVNGVSANAATENSTTRTTKRETLMDFSSKGQKKAEPNFERKNYM